MKELEVLSTRGMKKEVDRSKFLQGINDSYLKVQPSKGKSSFQNSEKPVSENVNYERKICHTFLYGKINFRVVFEFNNAWSIAYKDGLMSPQGR